MAQPWCKVWSFVNGSVQAKRPVCHVTFSYVQTFRVFLPYMC